VTKTMWKPTREQVLQGISYLRGAYKVALSSDHNIAQKAALRAVLESDIDRSSPLMKEAYNKYKDVVKLEKKFGKRKAIQSKPKSQSIDDVVNLSMADVINSASVDKSKPKSGESISDFAKRMKSEVAL
jgi:hypothetical protein